MVESEESPWTHHLLWTVLSSTLVIGAIFWAGAAYQRFKGIEGELSGIHSDIRQLVTDEREIEVIRNRQQINEQRISRLEDEMRQVR